MRISSTSSSSILMMLGVIVLLGAAAGLVQAQSGGTHGVSPEWGLPTQVSQSAADSIGVVGRGMAIDSQGRLHVVWTETQDGHAAYYAYSDDGGVTWSDGVDVSRSPMPAFGPNIAVGPDDTLHIIWNDRRNGTAQLYYSRSTDGGLTWSDPIEISGSPARDVSAPQISVDDNGRVHVAWHIGDPETDTEPTMVYYTRSLDGGITFETPRALNTTDNHEAFVRFNIQGTSGDLLPLSWRVQSERGDWDIYVGISTDGGETFTITNVFSPPTEDYDPEIIATPDGTLHLAFFTTRGGTSAILYMSSIDQGQSWSQPTVLSDARARFPFWVPDYEHGVLWLFWKDERDFTTENCGPGRIRCADIVARYSTDDGATWSELEFATDRGSTEIRFPSPAVGPDGRVHVIWSDRSAGDIEQVFISSRLTAPQ